MSYLRPNFAGAFGHPEQDDSKLLLWEASKFAVDTMAQHDRNLPRLFEIVNNLNNTLEQTRLAYNQAILDRDAKRNQLVAAENRLAEVQRVVQRYTVVQEPVVASDGYTYERSVIKQYLDECEASENSAYSQQTKEVLTDVLIPNQSLKKLVELLRTVKPQDVPQAVPRSAIPPLRSGAGGVVNWDDDENDESKEKKAIHASDLEAAFNKRADEKKPQPVTQPNASSSKGVAKSANTEAGKFHPCLRVYGFCNFKDDCSFAKYPYDACLNNIKGKCRFGGNCKELHVNPNDPKYQNPRTPSNSTPAPRSHQK